MNQFVTDVLICGGGLTGYRAAVAAAEAGCEVVLIEQAGCASPLVMGFNAAVNSNDSAELYLKDLVASGAGIGDNKLKMILANGASKQIHYLESLGISFNRKEDGEYRTLSVLGCTIPRLVQCGGHSGSKVLIRLKEYAQQKGVHIISGSVKRLIQEDKVVCGAYVKQHQGSMLAVLAKATVLATGGNGAIFQRTTYPTAICGEGHALALRVGARLVDMEFQQFEPCCFIYPPEVCGNLAVTTMLLRGGKLCNVNGEEFMKCHGRNGYQVQKSILASCIMEEVRNGRGTAHGGVWYDVTNVPRECVCEENSLFYEAALRYGVDLTKQSVEVAPIAHTNMGGIQINERCETGVPGLYAAGEVAGGVHGANRIGGCSGAETLVFGALAGTSAAEHSKSTQIHSEKLPAYEEKNGKNRCDQVRQIASKALDYDKEEKGLQLACDELDELWKTEIDEQTENMLLVAKAQILASLARRESRGVFFRTDYPESAVCYDGKSFAVRYYDGNMDIREIDVQSEETEK